MEATVLPSGGEAQDELPDIRELGEARHGYFRLLPPPSNPLEPVRRLVLEAVSSPLTREAYGRALDEFFAWREANGNPAFTRAAVNAWRASLEREEYAPASINQKLAAVRKLASEAALNGLLDSEAAAAIGQAPGAKQAGTRAGNWLTKRQAQALIQAPAADTLKGKRDRRSGIAGGLRAEAQ
jgi:site-specific recombinase XerD